MKQETIYELKTRKLMAEYLDLKDELLKKESYSEGLKKAIADVAKQYYEEYKGYWGKIQFDNITGDDADVRIGKVKVRFWGEDLAVGICVAVDPSALNKSIKWTEKEKKLLNKAKKLWNECADAWSLYNYTELKEVSEQLMLLKNEVEIVKEYTYTFREMELQNQKNICTDRLIIGKRDGMDVLLNMFENKE